MRPIRKLLTILVFTFCSISLSACSCNKLGTLKKSDLSNDISIFIGEALSVDTVTKSNYKELVYSFKVLDDLHNVKKDTLTITTPFFGSMCSLNINVGDIWFIDSYIIDNSLTSDLCTRSLNLGNINIWIPDDPFDGNRSLFFNNMRHARKRVKRFFKDYRKLDRWYWK